MPFKIVRNDITKMRVDAIVNTANEAPVYSYGTDSAVYRAAGAEELLAQRRSIGALAEGEAAVTPAFRLPARYIIHAVSPFYRGEGTESEERLRACYRNSLALALERQCESIAFPLIATGSCWTRQRIYWQEPGMLFLPVISGILFFRTLLSTVCMI